MQKSAVCCCSIAVLLTLPGFRGFAEFLILCLTLHTMFVLLSLARDRCCWRQWFLLRKQPSGTGSGPAGDGTLFPKKHAEEREAVKVMSAAEYRLQRRQEHKLVRLDSLQLGMIFKVILIRHSSAHPCTVPREVCNRFCPVWRASGSTGVTGAPLAWLHAGVPVTPVLVSGPAWSLQGHGVQ